MTQPEIEGHKLKLPAFEGPLDLLLHLIRTSEIDIYDIPIVEVTRQYDQYLEFMRDLDLHVAGEYLVMAATLLQIKSRMLLPRPPAGETEEDDPRADLVRQLIEHEKIRGAAENLRGLAEDREDVFYRAGDPLEPFSGESFIAVSIFDLVAALKSAIERLESGRIVEISRQEYSVEEKIEWLEDMLEKRGAMEFGELLAYFPSRSEKIVVFLALLELVRQRKVMAAQREAGGEILVMGRIEPSSGPMAAVSLVSQENSGEERAGGLQPEGAEDA